MYNNSFINKWAETTEKNGNYRKDWKLQKREETTKKLQKGVETNGNYNGKLMETKHDINTSAQAAKKPFSIQQQKKKHQQTGRKT